MQLTADRQIDELIERHEASWRLGYSAFPAVIQKMGLKKGAEIGVAFGGHSEAILQNAGVTKLYAVDSYKHRPEYDDPMNLPQPVFDRLFERTGHRLSPFGDRVAQIRLDSVEAARQISETLDFVYIDGDHSYEGIRADLEAWFPRVRPGGIIAGHDYGQPAFPGVKAAADHFFSRFGLTVQHEGRGVWWAHRPETPLTITISTSKSQFCDATLCEQLRAAGLTEHDTIILAHDERHPCDAVTRVLSEHPRLRHQAVPNLIGPWHAMTSAADHIDSPLIYPIGLDAIPPKDTIRVLRDRLCNSGAMAMAITRGQRTNDFGLAQLLATSSPPTAPGQIMLMTQALKQACSAMPIEMANGNERLTPWLVMANALAAGGRIGMETGTADVQPATWNTPQCRIAADAISQYASLIDGTDLLRLKWPTFANNWLNTLDRKPLRTRANVRPVDVPATYATPRMLDRVVHKFRRTMKGAA